MINPHSNSMNSCPPFEALILESIDSPLSGGDEARLNAHLGQCPACRSFLVEQRQLDALLSASLSRRALPADFKSSMLARIASLEAAAPGVGQEKEVDDPTIPEDQRPLIPWSESILPALEWVGYAALSLAAAAIVLELGSTGRIPWSAMADEGLQIGLSYAVAAAGLAAGLWRMVRNRSFCAFEWI